MGDILPRVKLYQMWHVRYKYPQNIGVCVHQCICTHTYTHTYFMVGPPAHPQAISPRINTISLHRNVWALSQQPVSPHVNTSKTIRTLCISPSLPYLAIGRSLPSLIPADTRCIKRTEEEKQNKHNGDNVFSLLLVSPSDKCWAHSVASWHACLRQPY